MKKKFLNYKYKWKLRLRNVKALLSCIITLFPSVSSKTCEYIRIAIYSVLLFFIFIRLF
jgi:hypothetical protein